MRVFFLLFILLCLASRVLANSSFEDNLGEAGVVYQTATESGCVIGEKILNYTICNIVSVGANIWAEKPRGRTMVCPMCGHVYRENEKHFCAYKQYGHKNNPYFNK